jgi:hypothetical protein
VKRKLDGFEKRELLGDAYWKDKRWKKVTKLRDEGKMLEANSLVFKIRESWGLND